MSAKRPPMTTTAPVEGASPVVRETHIHDTWVFGYGSLVWRPDFPSAEHVPAVLRGWKRRLWQGSPDHRGTPDLPGRVATLLADPAAHVHGVAYRLTPGTEAETLERLDVREVAGYALLRVPLTLADGRVLAEALVYVATIDNPWFLGPAPFAEMTSQIRAAVGASGPNHVYIERLASALAALGVADNHVVELNAALTARR